MEQYIFERAEKEQYIAIELKKKKILCKALFRADWKAYWPEVGGFPNLQELLTFPFSWPPWSRSYLWGRRGCLLVVSPPSLLPSPASRQATSRSSSISPDNPPIQPTVKPCYLFKKWCEDNSYVAMPNVGIFHLLCSFFFFPKRKINKLVSSLFDTNLTQNIMPIFQLLKLEWLNISIVSNIAQEHIQVWVL